MHPEVEKLIDLALADGQITEKERAILLRKAEALGEDKDEVEMVLDGRLHQLNQPTIKPTKEKAGVIKACPSCGANVDAFVNSCEQCGYEIRFDALKNLIDKIALNPNSERDIISKYKIPINKESFVEFFTFSIGKIEDDGLEASLRQVWIAKLSETLSLIKTTKNINIESDELAKINQRVEEIKWRYSVDSSTITNNANVNELLKAIQEIKDEKNNLQSTKGVKGEIDGEYFENKIVNLIRNYPIPSSKGEIINLLSVSVANGSTKTILGTLEKESLAWNIKAMEIIKKTRILYANETLLLDQLASFEGKMKGAKRQNDIIIFVTVSLVIIGIIFWVKSCK
ncbi:MAG: hypothetical protein EXR21_03665 [Flavobacteriaceae bacterium]|nr:hypothetical protein [Flavobacteriaceae bacterium]